MPIRTHGSNIRVETNVNGVIKDNDDWMNERSLLEHQHQDKQPWSQGYNPQEMEEVMNQLYGEPEPIQPDPEVSKANLKDLKTKNLDR